MPEKKARAQPKKTTPRGKKPMGLTSAIGPKATTMVVIIVMAGGIMVAARQQQTRAKEALAAEAARVEVALSPEPTPKNESAGIHRAGERIRQRRRDPLYGSDGRREGAARDGDRVPRAHRRRLPHEGHRRARTRRSPAAGSRASSRRAPPRSTWWISTRSLQLADHVGRRVSVTGTLVDREMQRPLDASGRRSCKAN